MFNDTFLASDQVSFDCLSYFQDTDVFFKSKNYHKEIIELSWITIDEPNIHKEDSYKLNLVWKITINKEKKRLYYKIRVDTMTTYRSAFSETIMHTLNGEG